LIHLYISFFNTWTSNSICLNVCEISFDCVLELCQTFDFVSNLHFGWYSLGVWNRKAPFSITMEVQLVIDLGNSKGNVHTHVIKN
jgi:hypothetical protein